MPGSPPEEQGEAEVSGGIEVSCDGQRHVRGIKEAANGCPSWMGRRLFWSGLIASYRGGLFGKASNLGCCFFHCSVALSGDLLEKCPMPRILALDSQTLIFFNPSLTLIPYVGFFFLRSYLCMCERQRDRERERGRDTGRGRSRLHAGSLMWDSIPGLQDYALGRKQAVNC